jgi:hypothetical protein
VVIGDFLLLSSPAALIAPMAVSICFFRRLTIHYKILCFFVFGTVIIEAFSYLFWLKKQNNLFMFNFYAIWELGLISLFYGSFLNNRLKKFISLLFITFSSFWIVDTFFISGVAQFSTYAKPIENITITLFAMYFFYKQFRQMKIINLRRDPSFLINTAFLIYFSATFYLFALSNYIMNESALTYVIWEVHTLLAWFYYSMIALALWNDAKRR